MTIKPIEVQRDESGSWTHPAYAEFCGERDYISIVDFNEWLDTHNLAWATSFMAYEDLTDEVSEYSLYGSFAKWQPLKPADKVGWFVGSIHDTDDGPICIWLRQKGTNHE